MARRLVRSLIVSSLLCSLSSAGPCRPSSSLALSSATTVAESSATSTTQTESDETGTSTIFNEQTSGSSSLTLTTTTGTIDATESLSTTDSIFSSTTDTTETSQTETQSTHTTTETSETQSIETSDTATDTTQTSETSTQDSSTSTDGSTTTESQTSTQESTSTSGSTTTTAESETLSSTDISTTTTEDVSTTTTSEASSTTSEPAPTCVDNLKNPLPSDTICAKRGGLTGGQSVDFRFQASVAAQTLFDCYKACQEKPNCKTFVFGDEGSFCELYAGTIQDTDGSDSAYAWYVPDCFCDTGIDPAPTCEDQMPILNGGWETGLLEPWDYYSYASNRPVVDFSIVPDGYDGSAYRFQTGNFHSAKSMWVYQDIEACADITFDCTFQWYWDEFYSVRQNDGSSLVPYVRIYQDNDDYALTSEFPYSAADVKKWNQGRFTFKVPPQGKTRIWYIASSPQASRYNSATKKQPPVYVNQPNALALDALVCQLRR
ncbi:hypothetical protein FZEAL_5403 [Fusarium zealandicum]|uniref:Apple domain-containing protein n=1 Tax=Fusarium zealandicum TaxID=1053134 RepID=A0A8H4UK66_9HYPO|nr:hypothetical protein FZEAL_5403 [Fusarium zealandicum]